MEFFFKYMAVRLWAGLFFGGLAAVVLLPVFADTIGLKWVIIPGLFLCMTASWLIDRIFSAIGRFQFNRLMREVTAWERAGMDREARKTLTRAESVANSFFFSPASRRQVVGRLMSRIARLQLAGGLPDAASEKVVGLYLRQFPQDRDAAIKWLEGVLSSQTTSPQIHDIAVRICAAHSGDIAVQQLLAQFYLLDRRCDFDALHTYQILMDSRTPVSETLVNGIADLFLSCRRADSLALQVYLAAYPYQTRNSRLVSGIAACRQMIRATGLTQPFLEKADGILASLTLGQRQEMAALFLPEGFQKSGFTDTERFQRRHFSLGSAIRVWARKMRVRFQSGWEKMTWLLEKRKILTPVVLRRIKMAMLGTAALAIGVLLVNTLLHLKTEPRVVEIPPSAPPPPPPPSPEVVVPVTDPFSLQIAAYLKEADARKFVEKLKNRGLDAYWIWTTSGGKTWYQVRLSHFKTKAEARAYGEALKGKQIINDYYITNYRAPESL